MEDGARVDVDEYEKDNARDFALWKAPKDGRSILGDADRAGPSGLAHRVFGHVDEVPGRHFDLHAGGEDLIFPHHENEIAQSEVVTGKTFAHFWFHARFLLVEGEKMSKSLGNFFTLARSRAQGSQAVVYPLSAGIGTLSHPAQFHLGGAEAGGHFGGSAAQFSSPHLE